MLFAMHAVPRQPAAPPLLRGSARTRGDVAGENVHFEPYFGSDSVMYRTAFEVGTPGVRLKPCRFFLGAAHIQDVSFF